MAFLDRDTALVLEKTTGRVQRLELSGGTAAPATTVLDLAVNAASERGLLGIAVHNGAVLAVDPADLTAEARAPGTSPVVPVMTLVGGTLASVWLPLSGGPAS